jgi:thioesterase domain-containing protein/acyl carrier protein
VEAEIAAAFAACLGVEEVGLDDHFFDLGGHSLLAVALLEMLEDKLGVRLPAQVLFEHGSVRALAAQAQGAFVEDPRPIALNRNLSGPTVFVLLGVHLYRELARHLEGRYSVQAVYAGRELLMFDSPGSAPSVEALAADYFGIIRRFQPTGPYRLVGMSFGGIVAYEVARQLRAAGQSVTFLGLLDTVLPERGLRARLAQLRRLQALPGAELARLVATRLRRWTGARRGGSSGSGVGVGVKPVSRSARASRHGEVEAYSGEARLLPLEDQRQEAYRIATETYVDRLEDFSGNVTLIVAARRMREVLLQSPSLGWGEVIPTLNVRNVESDHLGLLEEPHVAEVAAIFRAALD